MKCLKSLLIAAALGAATISPGAFVLGKRLSDSDRYSIYAGHAGAPVSKFRMFGSLVRWQPLGDEAIAVWTKPSQAWLLDFTGPCRDVEYAQAIGLTSTTGMVYARLDKVLVHSRNSITLPCFIARIRPLDVKAVKQSEKEAREQPRSASTG